MPISLAALIERVEQEIPELGVVTLESPTVGDVSYAGKYSKGTSSDHHAAAFSNALISTTIVHPHCTPDAIAVLPEHSVAILAEIVAALAGLRSEYDAITVNTPARERLHQSHHNYYRGLQRRMLDATRRSIQDILKSSFSDSRETAWRFTVPYSLNEDLSRSLELMTKVRLNLSRDASSLAELNRSITPSEEIASSATIESFKDLVAAQVEIQLPEPFLSDALMISGLNSGRIHSPRYRLNPVEPMLSLAQLVLRAGIAERRRLRDAFDTLMALEFRMRELVETKLRELHGDSWWRRGVPSAVRDECKDRKEKRETPFGPNHELISYCFVDELKSILLRNDNWISVFGAVFGNKIEVEAMFLWLNPVRNDIAHPRPITDVEFQQFVVAANWFMRRIEYVLGPDPSVE